MSFCLKGSLNFLPDAPTNVTNCFVAHTKSCSLIETVDGKRILTRSKKDAKETSIKNVISFSASFGLTKKKKRLRNG